jgi:hypothetical protein
MNGLETGRALIEARQWKLDNPDRRHEPQGIGEVVVEKAACAAPALPNSGFSLPNTDPAIFWGQACAKVDSAAEIPLRDELYNLLVEFALDVVCPEGYGHLMPPEVIKRANRILSMTEAHRKLKPVPPGVAPPPPRCEKCDSE